MSALTEVERNALRRLRISDEVIDRHSIEHLTAEEAYARYGIPAHGPGTAFKYFPLPNCVPRSELTVRLRLTKPILGDDGRPVKYLAPRGPKSHVYFAQCLPDWVSNPSTPVFIVEAEKSALAVLTWAETHRHPLIVVGLAGCYGWRGKAADGEKGTLGDLNVCKGRIVFICFDANQTTNSSVWLALHRLAEELLRLGARKVLLLTVPAESVSINGPDDLLGSKDGEEKFFEMLTSPEVFGAERSLGEEAEPAAQLSIPDMPEAVLGDTRLGEICRRRMLSAGFPVALAWLPLLCGAGTKVPLSGMPTNLYVAVVAPSGSGKSESIKRAFDIMGVEEPIRQKLMAGSAEGLFANLEDAKGEFRVISVDEMAHLMKKATIEHASFPYVLNRSYSEVRHELIVARGKRVRR